MGGHRLLPSRRNSNKLAWLFRSHTYVCWAAVFLTSEMGDEVGRDSSSEPILEEGRSVRASVV